MAWQWHCLKLVLQTGVGVEFDLKREWERKKKKDKEKNNKPEERLCLPFASLWLAFVLSLPRGRGWCFLCLKEHMWSLSSSSSPSMAASIPISLSQYASLNLWRPPIPHTYVRIFVKLFSEIGRSHSTWNWQNRGKFKLFMLSGRKREILLTHNYT